MRGATLLGLGAFAALSAAAYAATEQVITQKGRVFSEQSTTVKKGSAVVFFNDDTVPHNIMSVSKGNEFNLGSQGPGTSTPVTFSEVGDVAVICAIHPRMKMTVTITE
jgi:plastocyanin